MADVINFRCPQCAAPYRVAASFAGRAFSCKNCQQAVVVPASDQAPQLSPRSEPIIVAAVEMAGGDAVIRKTDSGRRVLVDPTRMIARDAVARPMAKPMAAQPAKDSSSKTLIIVGVIVLGVLGALAAAAAAGVFSSGPQTPAHTAQANTGSGSQAPTNTPLKKDESIRDKLLRELDLPTHNAKSLYELYQRAVAAKLSKTDLSLIARKAVGAAFDEQGGALDSQTLLEFGAQLDKAGDGGESPRLYGIVVARHRGQNPTPPEYERAQKALGREYFDFAAMIARAAEALETGLADDMPARIKECEQQRNVSDGGWVDRTAAPRCRELRDEINSKADEVANTLASDPFQAVVAKARKNFQALRVAKQCKWHVEVRQPFIFYCELGSTETKREAVERLDTLMQGVAQLHDWLVANVIEPAGLKRTLPSNIAAQDERNAAPFEIMLFRERGSWRPFLSEIKTPVDTNTTHGITEPVSGRFNGLYVRETAGENNIIGAYLNRMFEHLLVQYHPRADAALKDRADPAILQGWFMEAWFSDCVVTATRSGLNGDNVTYEFMYADRKWPAIMGHWRKPVDVTKNPDGQTAFNAFGGAALGVRDMIGATKAQDLCDAATSHFATYPGWTPEMVQGIKGSLQNPQLQYTLFQPYTRGLIHFLWNHAPEGRPKYRSRLLQFLVADMKGEVSTDKAAEGFAKAFALDEAGWKRLEEEFLAFQTS
ncbi:MAG: hypothetical protein IT463_15010 [Planctomycetes bacterium]|nr:hypothetical protein [Planctomycetota bacterium]